MRRAPTITDRMSLNAGALLALLLVAASFGLAARADASSFGLKGLDTKFTSADGSPEMQAGSHPFAITTTFAITTEQESSVPFETPTEAVRDLSISQIAGLVGDPTAVPRCTEAAFLERGEHGGSGNCRDSSAIGVAVTDAQEPNEAGEITSAVYNLAPPPGVAAEIGFWSIVVPVTVDLIVNPLPPYNVIAVSHAISNVVPVYSARVTLWGVPSDPVHDHERGHCVGGGIACPTDVPVVPFLTLPRSCVGPQQTLFEADSWQNPGVFVQGFSETHDNATPANPLGFSGCSRLGFSPTVEAAPSSKAAGSSSGLDFGLDVRDEGLTSPTGLAQSDVKKTVVTLPEGMVTNPSLASGLSSCTEADLARETVNAEPGEGCPEAAKIGGVEVETPLLEEPLKGSLFVATPHANPFDSLLGLYIVIKNPNLGIIVKQPVLVEPDPVTGRLVATADNLPQLPFSHFKLHFREGSRTPLITPSTCGSYSASAVLTPWSGGPPVTTSSVFQITTGANGGACPAGDGGQANTPRFEAGTTVPLAGAYSPFVFKVSREDGSQHFGAITASLPEGLIGKLAGISFCSEAQIAAARARSGEGQGVMEQSSPSCPEASQVGVVNITAGAGAQPYAVQGKAYLAGPYKDAPLSLAIVTPAIAGPFDLGAVVVRTALYIDRSTAQIRAVSDPIPQILDGIPLDVRSISLNMNRAGFTFNPTSCEPMSVGGEETSTLNQTAGLSNRFQVGGCQGLPFKPAMAISTQGKTSKANGASLNVKVSQKPGEADIHKVDLTLPTALPARLTTLQQACTETQFAANPAGCPAGSFIGTAKAVTPILSVPLTGPAILVSHGGAAFPDVVFLLQANERGANIRIDLDGRTDIKKGITYSRFETVPDAPIVSFETNLPQGPHSVLAATANLCTTKLAIPTQLVGQNGATLTQSTKVAVTGCPKAKTLTRAQKLALALKACHKKKGAKRATCEKAARHKYAPIVKRKGKKK